MSPINLQSDFCCHAVEIEIIEKPVDYCSLRINVLEKRKLPVCMESALLTVCYSSLTKSEVLSVFLSQAYMGLW